MRKRLGKNKGPRPEPRAFKKLLDRSVPRGLAYVWDNVRSFIYLHNKSRKHNLPIPSVGLGPCGIAKSSYGIPRATKEVIPGAGSGARSTCRDVWLVCWSDDISRVVSERKGGSPNPRLPMWRFNIPNPQLTSSIRKPRVIALVDVANAMPNYLAFRSQLTGE